MTENIDPKESSVVIASLPAGPAQETNNVAQPTSPQSTSPSQSLVPAPIMTTDPSSVVASVAPPQVVLPAPALVPTTAPAPTPAADSSPLVAPAPAPVVASAKAPSLNAAPVKRTRRGGAKHHVQLKSCRSELVDILSEIDTVQTLISSSVLAKKQPTDELIIKLQTLEQRKAAALLQSETVKNGYAEASKKAAERRLREATHSAVKSAAKRGAEPVATPAANITVEAPASTLSGLELASATPRSWASSSPESTSTVQIFTSPRPSAAVSEIPPAKGSAPARRPIQSQERSGIHPPNSSDVQMNPPGLGPPDHRAPSYAPRPGPFDYRGPSHAPRPGPLPYLAPPYGYQPHPSLYPVPAYGYQSHSDTLQLFGYPPQMYYGYPPPVVNAPATAPHPARPPNFVPRPPSQSSNASETVSRYPKPHAAPQPGWSTDNFPTSKSSKKTKSKSKGVNSKAFTEKSSAETSAKATKAKSPDTAVVEPQSPKKTTGKQPQKTKPYKKAASAKTEEKKGTSAENTATKSDPIKTEGRLKDTPVTKKAKKALKGKEQEKKTAAKTKAPKPNTFKPQCFDSTVQSLYLPVNDGSADFGFAPTGNDIDTLFEKTSPSTGIRVVIPDAPTYSAADFEFAPTGADMDSLFEKQSPLTAIRINIPAPPSTPTSTAAPSIVDALAVSDGLDASQTPSAVPNSTDLPKEKNDPEDDFNVTSAIRSGDVVVDHPAMEYEENEEDFYIGSSTRDIVLDFDLPPVCSESEPVRSEDENETVISEVSTTDPAGSEAPTSPIISSPVDVVAPISPAAPSTVPANFTKQSPDKLLAAVAMSGTSTSAAEMFPALASPTPKMTESAPATLVSPNTSAELISSKKKSPSKRARAARRRENRKAALATETVPDTSTQAVTRSPALSKSRVVGPIPIKALTTSLPESAVSSPAVVPSKMPESVPSIFLPVCPLELPVPPPAMAESTAVEFATDIALATSLPESHDSSPVMASSFVHEPVEVTTPTVPLSESPASVPVLDETNFAIGLQNPLLNSPEVSPTTSKQSPVKITKPAAASTESKTFKVAPSSSRTFRIPTTNSRVPSTTQGTQSLLARRGSSVSRPSSAASIRAPMMRSSSAASIRAPVTRPSSAASIRATARKDSNTPRSASMSRTSSASSLRGSSRCISGSSFETNDTSASSRTSRSSSTSVAPPGARSTSCTESRVSTRARSQSSASTGDRATASKPALAKIGPVKPITSPKPPAAQRTPLGSLLPLPRLKPATPVTGPKSPSAPPSSTPTIEPPPLAHLAPETAGTVSKSALVAPSPSAATPTSNSTPSKGGDSRSGIRAIAKVKDLSYIKSKFSMSVTNIATVAGPVSSPMADSRAQMSPIPGSPAVPSATRLPTPSRSANPYALYGQRGYDEDYSYGRK